MPLSDQDHETIRARVGRTGTINFGGHELVFRRPTRLDVRDYRRKQDTAAEKPDALDQIAQISLVAFDGEQDLVRARMAFLGFLDAFPLFTSGPAFMTVFSVLTGLVEAEDSDEMGKGVRVRSAPPRSTPTASATGFDTSSPVAS